MPHRRDEELLAAATRVFYARGYPDATVQEVAEELGILKGSLYHYIDSKEDLLLRIVDRIHDDAEAILDEVMAAELAEASDRLELYVRRAVAYNLREIERIAVYHRQIGRLTGMRRVQALRRRAAHERFIERLIGEARARREPAAALNARILSNLLFGSIVWVHTWYRPEAGPEPDVVVEMCCRFVLGGLTGAQAAEPLRAA
jgi:TetR/AcrR family transcriptional regulator, cholesterol catabolism regulator